MFIAGAVGTVFGLFLATRIELQTQQCVLYWYDKVFHNDYWITE